MLQQNILLKNVGFFMVVVATPKMRE